MIDVSVLVLLATALLRSCGVVDLHLDEHSVSWYADGPSEAHVLESFATIAQAFHEMLDRAREGSQEAADLWREGMARAE